MGAHRPRRELPQGCRGPGLTGPGQAGSGPAGSGPAARVVRVLPDVPALDRALDYLVPDDLGAALAVGTIVRVPLHGRRVRGWVVALDVEPATPVERLLPIRAVVSAGPPAELVALADEAARRWAGPRTAFLRPASPPNNVAPGPVPVPEVGIYPTSVPPVSIPDRDRRVVETPPATERATLIASLLAPEGSTIVLVPDRAEADALVAHLAATGREVVAFRTDETDASRTRTWETARHGARVVVGGRIAIFAPVPDLRAVIVLDDADEALADERAPSWHARDLAAQRAAGVGARLDILSPAPTVEAVALAGEPIAAPRPQARSGWPRLEVVDRRDDPPGLGLLSAQLGPALHRALDAGTRAVCVMNRKGRAHLLLCRACGEPARCERCDATVAEVDAGLRCARCETVAELRCRHCGSARFRGARPGVVRLRDDLAGLVPRHRVLAVDAASTALPAFDVAVGTEAVLHRVRGESNPIGLVAFLDFDQELLAPRHRAAEQALWLLVRAARAVGSRTAGSGGRDGLVLVQTRVPEHEVLRAYEEADPSIARSVETARRRDLGFPPFGGLAELRGAPEAVAAACIALTGSLTVLGPNGDRALVRAPDTSTLTAALATTDLGPARARGRLRIDVDPLRV
ncbi:MAG TPA: hypothetical protein VFW06_04380 [Acidimicrobiia bacterium]|nr:hypothetical protein [Acidimicrobiia bacterium]